MVRDGGFGDLTGSFDGSLVDSIYFSFTNYTTVGYGDIAPQGSLRFLAGVEAITGLSPYHLVCVIHVYGDDTILEWRLNLLRRSCVSIFSSCARKNTGQPVITLVTRIFVKSILRCIKTHFASPVLGVINRV